MQYLGMRIPWRKEALHRQSVSGTLTGIAIPVPFRENVKYN